MTSCALGDPAPETWQEGGKTKGEPDKGVIL